MTSHWCWSVACVKGWGPGTFFPPLPSEDIGHPQSPFQKFRLLQNSLEER